MENLQSHYQKTIAPTLQKKLSLDNPMAVPHLVKIVVNMGVKDAVGDKKLMEKMSGVLAQITGQKPKVTKAKKSIATFKLREGDPIGLVATLRGRRMYEFFDKIVKVVLPRMKDFHGVSRQSLDGSGNYALGLREYVVFPEIDLGTVDKMQGLEIIIVTSAKNDTEGILLLENLGIPFVKEIMRQNERRA